MQTQYRSIKRATNAKKGGIRLKAQNQEHLIWTQRALWCSSKSLQSWSFCRRLRLFSHFQQRHSQRNTHQANRSAKTQTMKSFVRIRQSHFVQKPKPSHSPNNAPNITNCCYCLRCGCLSFRSHSVAAARVIQLILLGEIRSRFDSIDSKQTTRDRSCGPEIGVATGILLFSCIHLIRISLQISLFTAI